MSSTAVFTRTSFYTVNGKIRSAAVSTKSRVDFLKDAQGNVVATTNYGTSQGIRQRFTPYGKVLGGTPVFYTDLRFGYGGTWGYRRTAMQHAETYIRARTIGANEARWTTRDPLWPGEKAYVYVKGRPTVASDPSGYFIVLGKGCRSMDSPSNACDNFGKIYPGSLSSVASCMQSKGWNAGGLEKVLGCIANQ